ncbi:CidA/LrgA family protein [Ureibacillus aquaedulcis]|uniref:CidA/LrgA family protein n=1 Tax=Ureibacillus aquaedulcis TaxID=3058421 RepID=A0ABT8GLS5_9BACL|nr:CidA/LrgA family protein [Ureibacillus sp. BA0131]MDN4492369.1 CidA/LrgA family protein [Ureibacillus sp. BA0131]
MAIKVIALSYCLLMKIIRTIAQILILYAFYYIGVFVVEITGLPLPASILGLVLLAFCLQMKWVKVEYIQEGAGFLIAFMTLFFIPPIVGIIDYPQLLSVEGFLLLGSVFVSTLFAILISSKLSEMIEKKELELIEKKEFKSAIRKEQEFVEQLQPDEECLDGENQAVPVTLSKNQPQQNESLKEAGTLESNHLHR